MLTDESPMPFGPYLGKRLGEVSAEYLLALDSLDSWQGGESDVSDAAGVRDYIIANREALQFERRQNALMHGEIDE